MIPQATITHQVKKSHFYLLGVSNSASPKYPIDRESLLALVRTNLTACVQSSYIEKSMGRMPCVLEVIFELTRLLSEYSPNGLAPSDKTPTEPGG